MATHSKHLETAEVAYSAIMEADKVHYIQYIRELPVKEVRNAEMAVLTGINDFEIGFWSIAIHLVLNVFKLGKLFFANIIILGNYADAETILLQAGLTFRAILMNIHLHQWEKALDLSIKHKTHVDTVLAYRIKHLQRCDAEETIDKYNAYMKEVDVDWEKVAQKVESEFQKERERK